MRQGPNSRRSRGRGGNNNPGGGGGGNNNNQNRRQNGPMRHQTFDSNGPDVRIRGTAFQIYEKYQALARDAQSSGDRVAAENYQQHAEHYYRIILQINEQEGRSRQGDPRQGGNGNGQPYHQGGQAEGDEMDEGESGAAEGGEDDREPAAV